MASMASGAPARYHGFSIALHWLMAAMLAGLFAIGLYMADLELSPAKLRLYAWHKWLGVTIFVLLWLRLVGRLLALAPLPLPAPDWQLRVVGLVHGLMYSLMLVLPVSGWLMSSAAGFQTVWFGIVPLPDLLPENQAWFEVLKVIHEILAWKLASLVGLHLAGVFKHHVIDRDGILSRMWPTRKMR